MQTHMCFPPAEDFIQNLKRTGKELMFYVTGDTYHCTIHKSKSHGFYRCENRLRNLLVICAVCIKHLVECLLAPQPLINHSTLHSRCGIALVGRKKWGVSSWSFFYIASLRLTHHVASSFRIITFHPFGKLVKIGSK